jgi:hypothetical protein
MAQIDFTPDPPKIDFQPDQPKTSLGRDIATAVGRSALALPKGIAETFLIPPAVEGIQQIGKAGKLLSDVIHGQPLQQAEATDIPESQTIQTIRDPNVPREQRIETGIGFGLDVASLGLPFLKGARIKLGDIIRERARIKQPGERGFVLKSEQEAAAARPKEEVKPSATEEGKVKEGVPTERPRDDTRGTPAEAGVSGGVQPTAEVPQETVNVAGAPFTGATVQEALKNAHQSLAPEMSEAEFVRIGRETDPEFKGIDPAELDKYAGVDAGTEAARPSEPTGFSGEGTLPEPTEREEPTPSIPIAKGKPGRPPADAFGTEVTPISQHIIDDVGGIMSKATAKRLGIYEQNKELWEGVPALKASHSRKIFAKKGGETPDKVANSLFEAGRISDDSSSVMWEELEKESKGARSLAEQEKAQKQIEKEGERVEEKVQKTDDDRGKEGEKGRVLEPAAEETPPSPAAGEPSLGGIKQTVAERRSGIEPGEGWTAKQAIEWGEERLKEGAAAEPILEKAYTTGHLKSGEIAIARAHIRRLEQATNNAHDALYKDPTDPTLQANAAAADRAEAQARARLKPAQTDWQKAGAAQQYETEIDTGSIHGLRRLFQTINKRDATPQELKGLEKEAAKSQQSAEEESKAWQKWSKAVDKATKTSKLKTRDELANHFAERLKALLPCK